ncbi:MAG: ThiF family adenylyltransferase [Phycisphaerales bacterium]
MESVSRYHRQTLLAEIGEEGQRRLGGSHALLVGCGALGTVIADGLARAGVGRLTLVDRDLVERTNLQRQILFDESDVRDELPKAEAARRKLARINSEIEVRAIVDDFRHSNAEVLAADADVLLDGLDNFETRFLLNDLSVKLGIPYVYGGAVGTNGMTATFLPHTPGNADRGRRSWTEEEATPCLRCLFESAPPAGSAPTCDTVGVLGPAVGVIANLQAAEAIKTLTRKFDSINRGLVSVDLWSNEWRRLNIASAYADGDCATCRRSVYQSLEGCDGPGVSTMCGRNAVQINPARPVELDLSTLEGQLRAHGATQRNAFLLRCRLRENEGVELTIFPNGRTIVHGVDRPEQARSLYARYIGA